MNPILVPGATWDLVDIVDWYEQGAAGLGVRFRAAFDGLVATLCRQPRLFHRVSRPPRRREVRVALVPRFPFLVHYELTATEVVILSVVHAKSRYRPWRSRLPTP